MPKKHSKRFRALLDRVDGAGPRPVEEAIGLLKELASAKFNETIEFSTRLGVDPRKAEENVRGTLVLPHGTGRVLRVACFAKGEAAMEAEAAGAETVGDDDLIAKIEEGWAEFDVLVAHTEMMRSIGRLGKKLGPRMPNKKSGTVSETVGEAIRQIKAGKVEYRVDRQSNINCCLGKASFSTEQLMDNFKALFGAVLSAKPAALKGVYVRQLFLTSTMSPSIKIDVADARSVATS